MSENALADALVSAALQVQNDIASNEKTVAAVAAPSSNSTSSSAAATEASSNSTNCVKRKEPSDADLIKFKLTHGKDVYRLECSSSSTVGELRQTIHEKTGIAPALAKIMFKGVLKNDSATLKSVGIANGVKVMVLGTSIKKVMSVAAPDPSVKAAAANLPDEMTNEPLCEQEKHKKILAKGVPEDAEEGLLQGHRSVPETGMKNILNNRGTRVRVTFRSSGGLPAMHLNTVERTSKVPYSSIRSVKSEEIKGHEGYHIVEFKLGSTKTNDSLFLYWVPAQYVKYIEYTCLADYGY